MWEDVSMMKELEVEMWLPASFPSVGLVMSLRCHIMVRSARTTISLGARKA